MYYGAFGSFAHRLTLDRLDWKFGAHGCLSKVMQRACWSPKTFHQCFAVGRLLGRGQKKSYEFGSSEANTIEKKSL